MENPPFRSMTFPSKLPYLDGISMDFLYSPALSYDFPLFLGFPGSSHEISRHRGFPPLVPWPKRRRPRFAPPDIPPGHRPVLVRWGPGHWSTWGTIRDSDRLCLHIHTHTHTHLLRTGSTKRSVWELNPRKQQIDLVENSYNLETFTKSTMDFKTRLRQRCLQNQISPIAVLGLAARHSEKKRFAGTSRWSAVIS